MNSFRVRELSKLEKGSAALAAWLAIPSAILTAWLFSWVTSLFDVDYPSYINWLVGYISLEADHIKIAVWKQIRSNTSV